MAAYSDSSQTGLAASDAQRRRGERRECNFPCRIATRDGELNCRITNVSTGGVGLSVDTLAKLKVGDKLRIVNGPLSGSAGFVRWASAPKYGVEFEAGLAASSVRSLLAKLERFGA